LKKSFYFQGWKKCNSKLCWIISQKNLGFAVIYRLDVKEKRRQEEEKCVCVTAYRRDTKRLRKDLRLLLETKSVGAATECCLLAIDGRRTARAVYTSECECVGERERSAAGCVFVTPIDTLTDGFSKSMHQNSDRLE